MAVNSVQQFFSNRPVKNGSAVFVVTPHSGGYFVNSGRADLTNSGDINALAQHVADNPRYYAGDTSA